MQHCDNCNKDSEIKTGCPFRLKYISPNTGYYVNKEVFICRSCIDHFEQEKNMRGECTDKKNCRICKER